MICQKCGKNNATTHIHSVIGGIVKDIDLCPVCAAKEGYTGIAHNSLAGMLASMLGETAERHIAATSKKCAVCGADFHSITSCRLMQIFYHRDEPNAICE